jgi:hypothetical protein
MLPAPGGECLPLPLGFVGMTGSFRFSQTLLNRGMDAGQK